MIRFIRSSAPEVAKGVSVGLIVLSVSTVTSGALQMAARALDEPAAVSSGRTIGGCREPSTTPRGRHVEMDLGATLPDQAWPTGRNCSGQRPFD